MPATNKALTGDDRLEAGATFRRNWQLMNPETAQPHDITGLTFRSSFRLVYADAAPAFIGKITVTDALTGLIEFVIEAEDSAQFADGKEASQLSGVWDLESTDSGSPEEVVRWMDGQWTMTQESTQDGDADPYP